MTYLEHLDLLCTVDKEGNNDLRKRVLEETVDKRKTPRQFKEIMSKIEKIASRLPTSKIKNSGIANRKRVNTFWEKLTVFFRKNYPSKEYGRMSPKVSDSITLGYCSGLLSVSLGGRRQPQTCFPG